jgi:predicted ABC-type ATPase
MKDPGSRRLPEIYLLGGPNGAGKTTAAREFLAKRLELLTFVNADVIAQGLSGFAPDTVAREAARIMLQRVEELAASCSDFALESTISGLTLANSLKRWKAVGYRVHIAYFWLRSPDLAVARVAERVRKGGHSVPEETIRRRWRRSARNFFARYRPLADTWEVYDNTAEDTYRLMAHGDPDFSAKVLDANTWAEFQRVAEYGKTN